jgi:photosystem II stability/assembly factor-like uncharacterized protein
MSMLDWLSTTNWTAFGPAPIDTPNVGLGLGSGRIEAAAPHPVSTDVMYVAGSAGGVWKTGVWNSDPPVWLALGDAEESLSVAGYHPLVVHPANHNLILATVCGHGAGVLKSTNGGLTWKLLGSTTFEGATIGSIAVDPADTDILYVSVSGGSSGGGVYKSIDGGNKWMNTTSSVHAGNATDVILSRFTPHMLYAGMVATWYKAGAATAGVYKSENGGNSWDLLPGLPSGSGLDTVRLESGSKQGVVYVTCFRRYHGKTFVKRAMTSDNGAKWNALAKIPGEAELRPWHLLLGVDPADDKHVFANGNYALFESIDGGKTWARADVNGGNPIGDDWVNIAFQPNGRVVVTADRDVYRYDPKKKTWQSKEGNLQVTQFYDITLDPNDSDIAYGVAQDHSAAMKFTGSVEWAYLAGAGGETHRHQTALRLEPAQRGGLRRTLRRRRPVLGSHLAGE